ncbi:MAG: Nif11-like leader peptide family RiPP precursor [Pseudodesulfovibrio sp.]
MSKAEMIRFAERLKGDEKMRNEVKGMGTDFVAVAAYATEQGFSLSASDFSLDEELSDDDLHGIAGGSKPFFAGPEIGGFIGF